MTTVKDIYDYINVIAPFDTQEEWDNAGLITGSLQAPVSKVVMSLDVTKAAVRKAAEINAQLILSHHPLIFGGVKRLLPDTALYMCAQNGISVISAHTNFDKAEKGINANLCKILELNNAEPVEGTFISVGDLKSEMTAHDFACFVSKKLNVSGIRYTDTQKMIRKVAVGGGACDEYLPQAMALADCFVTGDTKYHVMLEASENDFCIIGAGHYETESQAFLMLKDLISKEFPDVEFISAEQKNPVSAVL